MTAPTTPSLLARAKAWARAARRDVLALWFAARDRRVAWHVKALCAAIAAYALSPIDLIPDFIPVLGYLDEVILLPLAIRLAVRLVPPSLMAEFRLTAEQIADRPVSRAAAVMIVLLWLAATAAIAWAAWRGWS